MIRPMTVPATPVAAPAKRILCPSHNHPPFGAGRGRRSRRYSHICAGKNRVLCSNHRANNGPYVLFSGGIPRQGGVTVCVTRLAVFPMGFPDALGLVRRFDLGEKYQEILKALPSEVVHQLDGHHHGGALVVQGWTCPLRWSG